MSAKPTFIQPIGKYKLMLLGFSIFILFISVFIYSYLIQSPKSIKQGLGASFPGDVNGDGMVDIIDFQLLSNSFGKSSGQSGYNANADFNSDNTVDILDFQVLSNNFGKVSTTATPTTRLTTNTPTPRTTITPTSSSSPTYDQVRSWVLAYKAAHPGNGGKDWDINAKTDAQIAADPAAQQLLSLCTPSQKPVYPLIAWEYGGNDHPWINPDSSALLYCVYNPVQPSTSHWSYNVSTDRVTADVYIKFPDQNPCKNEVGKNQVINCLGDPTNSEVLVDTASFRDGHDAGLELSTSSSELFLILPDGSKVQLLLNI